MELKRNMEGSTKTATRVSSTERVIDKARARTAAIDRKLLMAEIMI